MRQMTGSMLLLSAAAVAAAPLADAEERTIQLTEAEKQEIQAANEKLLGLTLRFLHDSWPLEIMFAGEAQQEFHSILQCYRMLEQFRETGNLMLQAPDRNTPLHLCIALGLNQLAIRMIEAGAPVNAQSIFMHDGTKEPGDTPPHLGLPLGPLHELHGGRQAAAGAVPAQARGRPGPAGTVGRHPVHVLRRPQ